MRSSVKENIFDGIIERMPDALIVTNKKGVIEVVNKKVFDVFGYLPEELIGKEIEILIPEKYRKQHKANVQDYFEKPIDKKMAAHRTVSGLKKNGTEFEIDITLATLTIDNETYAIASARNIADKKHLEEELKLENISLQLLNKGLEKYSYTVTHDLKAPLTKINGLIDLLTDEIKNSDTSEQLSTIIQYIKDSVSSMDKLITDILDEAKKGKMPEENERIYYSEILEELKNLIIIPKKFSVKVHCDSLILTGKKIQFIQVFLNLFSNAIKFNNKKDALIEINCEERDNEYKFTFFDNGIGIEKEKLEKVFTLFESNKEDNQGHGVGLYTVKSIIEARGGKIWADSKKGEWTKFEFTWPKTSD